MRLKISLNQGLWTEDVKDLKILGEMRNIRGGCRSLYYRSLRQFGCTAVRSHFREPKSTICLPPSGFYPTL
ncbi:hypothetical protein QUB68_19205 [Microcoleus sp. A006_D1]